MTEKIQILYLNKNFVQIARYNYGRGMSGLEFDFIFYHDYCHTHKEAPCCEYDNELDKRAGEPSIPLEIRKKAAEVLRKHYPFVREYVSKHLPKKWLRTLDRDIEDEDFKEKYIFPHAHVGKLAIGIGQHTIIFFKLPSEMIDKIINEDKLVDFVIEWANKNIPTENEEKHEKI